MVRHARRRCPPPVMGSAALPSACLYGGSVASYLHQFSMLKMCARARNYSNAMAIKVSYMNSTAGLDQSCVAAMVALGEDPLECRWPEVVVKFIDVPVFVMNSRFDPALDGISGGTGGKNSAGVVRVGSMLEKLVNSTVLTAPKNAAFITSCAQHCGQWAQGQVQGQ